MNRSLLFILGILLGLQTDAFASFAERFNVSYLNMGNGLPSNFVDDIYEDGHGFIWIATHGGGLMRYDGYTYYYMGAGHSDISFQSNYCRNVYEDSHRRLWVSFDEYTDVIDLRTMRMTTPPCASRQIENKLKQVLKERSMRVFCDKGGNVWIATREHIYALGFDQSGILQTIWQQAYQNTAPDVAIKEIDGLGVVTAFGGRVHRYVLPSKAGGIRSLRDTPMPPRIALPNGLIILDFIFYNHQLWFATNQGLYQSGSRLTAYRHTSSPSSLSHDFVAALAISPDGNLLVGTLAGVDILKDGTFEHWNTTAPTNPLSSNFVNCLQTGNGTVWVGTESGGITMLSARQLQLRNYVHDNTPGSLSANAVNAIYAEKNGTMWVGTVEGGLNRMLPGTNVFTHYTTSNSALSHNSVSAFAADGSGRLWIGTWGGGVNSVDMKNPGKITPFVAGGSYTTMLSFIGALAYDPYNDGLWIGSNDGIFFYDMKQRKLTDPFSDSRNIHGCIGSLVDHEGKLWMGCLDGMVKIDLRRRHQGRFAFKQYRNKLDAPSTGVIDKITCFCQTKDGTVWMGSNGYGLYRRMVDKTGKETFKCYTVADGLANNSVRGIAEGSDGTLWIATEHGLSVFNPASNVFANYNEEDGLVSSQFYFNGALRTASGKLVFGSFKGLTIVNAVDIRPLYEGQLCFTQLWVNGRLQSGGSRFLDEDIVQAQEINVREGDKSFVIEFSSLNYLNGRQGNYSYRMDGYDDKWIPLKPGEHSVRYTSLPPGHYDFMVRYAASLGKGSVQEISIEVNVAPYFWKSWWFVTLMVIALALLAAAIYRKRMEQMKRMERERILEPIEKALKESDTPQLLQKRIEAIMDNQQRYTHSHEKVVEADREETLLLQKPFMERVMEAMEANYSNPDFGVTELSDVLNVSKPMLSKQLNAEIGLPTNQFIRNYRLEIAKKFIEQNIANRNITEIAYRVGFNDPKYFTRCFTKLYGVAPSAYKAER
ncbi:MAG: helix-turn-helix domain-containing protein [Prevotella sp.]|nr:helix-turn-helix domain-containing protein [Prevotella sp.]